MEPRKNKGTQYVPIDSKVIVLREGLAQYAHDYWRRHMEFLFDQAVEVGDGSLELHHLDVTRWRRRMGKEYQDASPEEKDMFRFEADNILEVLKKHGS